MTVERLQEKLQHLRLRRHQAERELHAIERQQALHRARNRGQREWERAVAKVTKLKEEETQLLEEIQKLTQPAAASEETAAAKETTA
ncbi:MAG: hypothetical protein NZT92_16130 [Abditibacteriales bacterium]|nr:hypothetical protein [Abditibacteriales bacterium]MDW8365042.1 hypothetical protein [Abditibacteriales bacterium]